MAARNAINAVPNYPNRFHTERLNLKQDERIAVLKEALEILEEKSETIFPTVQHISGLDGYEETLNNLSNNVEFTITLAGTNLGTEEDSIEVSVGGVSEGIVVEGLDDENQDAMELVFNESGGDVYTPVSTTIGDQHLCQIRINDTLVTEFMITVQ